MTNQSKLSSPIVFSTSEGNFAYFAEEMQIYPVNQNEDIELTTPLIKRPQLSFSPPSYVKATISVVNGCNLGCSYCSFGKLPAKDLQKMNPETGKAIIDYLIKTFGHTTDKITISFTSNGEPSLNLDTIEAIKAYARAKAKLLNGLSFRFNFATNSIPLPFHIIDKYLCEEDQDLFFSTDGPSEVHDQIRTGKNGAGSYSVLQQKIEYYRERYEKNNKGFSSSTVLTAKDGDFAHILLHLDHLGFEYIVMRPIRGSRETDFGLNERTLPIFLDGYKSLIDLIETRAMEGDINILYKVCNRYDFYGRLFSAMILGEKRVQGCPGCPPIHTDIARYSLVFDTEGNVYFPCRDFIGKKDFCIGNVFTEVNLDMLRINMNEVRTNVRPDCQSCWVNPMCGGGCYNAALAAKQTILHPDTNLCNLTRYLGERALRMIYLLVRKQPQMIPTLFGRALDVTPWVWQV